MGRQTFRVASDEIPIAPGGESPFSGTPGYGAFRGCWRGPNPAGSHHSIEQRVSFLTTASERRVIVLPTKRSDSRQVPDHSCATAIYSFYRTSFYTTIGYSLPTDNHQQVLILTVPLVAYGR